MRPSKIDKLNGDVRDFIAARRAEGNTSEEIRQACLEAFPDVPDQAWPSRSKFAAHVQGVDKLADKVQRSRAIAEALVRRLGDAPESRQARLNIELMHSIVTDVALAAADAEEDGRPVTLDASQVHFLAKSLDHLARARRADLEATLRLRKEAASDVAQAAQDAGLSAERIAELQAKVAGVRIDPQRPAA